MRRSGPVRPARRDGGPRDQATRGAGAGRRPSSIIASVGWTSPDLVPPAGPASGCGFAFPEAELPAGGDEVAGAAVAVEFDEAVIAEFGDPGGLEQWRR